MSTGAKTIGLSSKMPTTRHFFLPVGTVIVDGVADVRGRGPSAQSSSSSTVPSREVGRAPVGHVQLEVGPTSVAVATADAGCVVAVDQSRSRTAAAAPGRRRRRRPSGRRSPARTARRRRCSTTKSPMKFSSTGLSTDALAEAPRIATVKARVEPDHQRRRGGRRTPRVAQRVLPGQPARRAEQPRVGRAGGAQERPADAPGWPRSRPAGSPARPAPTHQPLCGTAPTNRPTSGQRDADARSARAPSSSRRRTDDSGSATSSRSAWTGAIRPVRRAGSQAATIVTTMPMTYAAITVRGARISGCSARSRPNVRDQRPDPHRQHARPSPRPSVDAERAPTTNASSCTERITCRLRGAQGAQQRELAAALGDQDREGVDDDVAARRPARCRRRSAGRW